MKIIYILAGYPASLETLSPGLSPPPSLVPLSPLSYSSLPSTLPPSDYPASLRITAFPRYFLNLKLSYFEMFAPNPPPPRRMGWGGGYMFWLFFRQNFFLSIFSAVREISRIFEMLTPNPPPESWTPRGGVGKNLFY